MTKLVNLDDGLFGSWMDPDAPAQTPVKQKTSYVLLTIRDHADPIFFEASNATEAKGYSKHFPNYELFVKVRDD